MRARRDQAGLDAPTPWRRRLWALTAFASGAAIMALELAALRLFAPFFGQSIYVWGNLLSVVMVALALGYVLGGHLADRATSDRGLYLLLALGALYQAAVVLGARALLARLTALDELLGSALATLILTAPPLVTLAACSPFVIRLLARAGQVGEVAGRIYALTDADIDFGLGDVDSRSYGVSLYGTYYVGGLYVDLHGSFNWNTYDTTRRIFYTAGPEASGTATGLVVDRRARGDTDGHQYTVNLGAGYDFRRGPWTLTPYGRLEYLNLHIDGYTERGAQGLDLTIRSQRVESLQSALGGRVAYAISTPVGVVVPQAHAEWRHEFQNDARSITANYTHDPFDTFFAIPTDRPDRDYAALGAGVSGVFRRGVAAFLSYETILGLRDVSHHSFTGGVRVEF
jgi:uncharacterized protein YhjY with autotransporter beta-barrel domain